MTPLIAEELLLLAYSPDGVARGKGIELDMAVGGALLSELAGEGHLELRDGRLEVTGIRPGPAHPVLREVLAQVAKRPRRPKSTVTRVARGARHRLLACLVEAGVLADEPRRVLLVFPGHKYPLVDPRPRDAAAARLRAAVDNVDPTPDARTAALAGLLEASRLYRRVFPDDDRRVVQRRLRELGAADFAPEAVRAAIKAARAARAAASSAAATSGGAG
ncbi:MAG TPA: GPP34 family phosphoprotein [Pseudonocardia sp.]|jgi:hypothetical protein